MERELIPAIVWNFLDNLREGVLILSPDGHVEYMNDAAFTALGLDISREYVMLSELLPPAVKAATRRKLLRPPLLTHIRVAGQPVELESHAFTAPPGPGLNSGLDGELIQILVRPLPGGDAFTYPAEYQTKSQKNNRLTIDSTHLKTLLHITSELSASLDQDWVLTRALEMVNEVVNASQGVILLIDQESGELVFRASLTGNKRQLTPQGLATGMRQNEGLAGWIIAQRTPVIVHDTRQDPRWIERETSKEHRSVLAVPLISNEEVIGVLMLFQNQPRAFTKDQLDLVETAAVQVANAISNANLYQLIRQQAKRLGTMLRLEQIETAKNQAILESIANGVIVADSDHKIVLANPSASAILELPRRQLIDTTIDDLLDLYGLRDQSWIPAVTEWVQNKEQLENREYLEEQLPIGNKVINVRISPVLAGNQFFGTVSILRDITKETEVDRLKSEFVSTVSHELRTPMTSIKGYIDMMLMGITGQMTPDQTRYLRIIQNNAGRLQALVDDLLNISRIETGKLLLNLHTVDITHLIDRVVDGHVQGRLQHERKQVDVKKKLPETLPLVYADEARITQVLTNLLDNAINYTADEDEIEVSAAYDDEANSVRIDVTDSGIGIAEEEQKKIFDRFYRANNETVQNVAGTGLGLAIVHSIVKMHGGQMDVTSKLGEGSTFSFSLPSVPEEQHPTDQE